jgi:hypothetical protein
MLFKMIELPSDEPVAFVGCYVLKWGRVDEPTVAFREATPEEIAAEQGVQADGLTICQNCGSWLRAGECENCNSPIAPARR